MKELICQGQPVKLDGLGTFYPTIEGTGADSVLEYLPAVNIKGVHLRFLPEGSKDDDITSRALKDACVFEMHDVVETKTKLIGGKEKTYQERTPISTYAISEAEHEVGIEVCRVIDKTVGNGHVRAEVLIGTDNRL